MINWYNSFYYSSEITNKFVFYGRDDYAYVVRYNNTDNEDVYKRQILHRMTSHRNHPLSRRSHPSWIPSSPSSRRAVYKRQGYRSDRIGDHMIYHNLTPNAEERQ